MKFLVLCENWNSITAFRGAATDLEPVESIRTLTPYLLDIYFDLNCRVISVTSCFFGRTQLQIGQQKVTLTPENNYKKIEDFVSCAGGRTRE